MRSDAPLTDTVGILDDFEHETNDTTAQRETANTTRCMGQILPRATVLSPGKRGHRRNGGYPDGRRITQYDVGAKFRIRIPMCSPLTFRLLVGGTAFYYSAFPVQLIVRALLQGRNVEGQGCEIGDGWWR